MPNDTLDEIEARWKDEPRLDHGSLSFAIWATAHANIRALIEMVRARDRVVEAARKWDAEEIRIVGGWNAHSYNPEEIELHEAVAALAAPAQEQKR